MSDRGRIGGLISKIVDLLRALMAGLLFVLIIVVIWPTVNELAAGLMVGILIVFDPDFWMLYAIIVSVMFVSKLVAMLAIPKPKRRY